MAKQSGQRIPIQFEQVECSTGQSKPETVDVDETTTSNAVANNNLKWKKRWWCPLWLSRNAASSSTVTNCTFLFVTLPILIASGIAHIYSIIHWDTYKQLCFVVLEGERTRRQAAPTTAGVNFGASLMVWLTAWSFWLTCVTIFTWVPTLYLFHQRERTTAETSTGSKPKKEDNGEDDPDADVDCSTTVAESNNSFDVEQQAVVTEASNDDDADRKSQTSTSSNDDEVEVEVATTSTKPDHYLLVRMNQCLFQIALPVALTTLISYLVVTIDSHFASQHDDNQSSSPPQIIDHNKCLELSGVGTLSVIDRTAPNTQFWLVMDWIYNLTAHYLCSFILLFVFVTKRIQYDYSPRCFISSVFFLVALAISTGFIHAFHYIQQNNNNNNSPSSLASSSANSTLNNIFNHDTDDFDDVANDDGDDDVPNFWLAAIHVGLVCVVMEGLLKLIWAYRHGQNGLQ